MILSFLCHHNNFNIITRCSIFKNARKWCTIKVDQELASLLPLLRRSIAIFSLVGQSTTTKFTSTIMVNLRSMQRKEAGRSNQPLDFPRNRKVGSIMLLHSSVYQKRCREYWVFADQRRRGWFRKMSWRFLSAICQGLEMEEDHCGKVSASESQTLSSCQK